MEDSRSNTADELGVHRMVLECVHSGVYVVGPDRSIVIWNSAAEQITGICRSEVEGRTCGDSFLAHVDREGNQLCHGRCPLAATLSDGMPRDTLVFLRHKCGHRVAVDVHIERLADARGRVIGAVESFVHRDLRMAGVEKGATNGDVDPLTGLPDSEHAAMQLAVLLAEARVFSLPITGVLVKLEDLHSAMIPRAMLAAARTLRDAFPQAIVARWKEHNFLVVDSSPHIEPASVAGYAESLIRSCEIEGEGQAVRLGARAAGIKSLASDDAGAFIWRLEQELHGQGALIGGIVGEFEAV
jgi:PAS domain S-box-containing protein